MNINFIIIGQGLAGSLLAWELIKRKQKILIIDNGAENASRVAAGMINPITGMRFAKAADVGLLLNTAREYYAELSCFFQQSFYHDKPMLRLLRNQKELVTAKKRLTQTEYQPYLGRIDAHYPGINCCSGVLQQNHTGYLITHPLLDSLRQFFIKTGCYLKTQLDYSDILFDPQLQWRQFKPQQIIFCEGYAVQYNPWFNSLPFQPVKGEILTLHSSTPLLQKILNYGYWFIPLENGFFKTGATFDRKNLHAQISHQAQQTLVSSLLQVYPGVQNAEIINHQAGIRPTTLDKQAMIGHHPRYHNLAIFNGFGSKGSLQIPYYCQSFVDKLLNKARLDNRCNIKRYYETYFTD